MIILLGSSTPIIWNRLLTSFSCKSSSTPSRISPPMVLAKAEYVCQIDFGTSAFARLHSKVTRSPLSNASFIVFSSISFAKLINYFEQLITNLNKSKTVISTFIHQNSSRPLSLETLAFLISTTIATPLVNPSRSANLSITVFLLDSQNSTQD